MSSPPRELPEFCNVYLPEYSSDRLLIPTAFLGHFNGVVPEKAILRGFSGRVWLMEVGLIGKDVYFLNGWQRFRTDNSLEEGVFLVFRYDGSHIFDFKLFGRNQCEKIETDNDQLQAQMQETEPFQQLVRLHFLSLPRIKESLEWLVGTTHIMLKSFTMGY
ncbi:B3 domain-containing protein At3g06220-like [Vitis riparia]|uniref:B3 domain-containing protein At3g06220-like n=2 Tax=Vitis riparia TaxID=96939 RepID=UPI00155AD410|nr:B3 domain-containing protein At3g06220-like [Vitis riparia]